MIAGAGAVLAIAAALVLFALRDQIVFFYSPTELAEKELAPGTRVRLGGLVADGSIVRGGDGGVRFAVTDTANSTEVDFHGVLPDLFREGQGVIATGTLEDGVFVASEVLARHDESYMPKEVADALKEQGLFRYGGGVDPEPGS
jgi:cytochrome c-type biogenesis protein CcmE